MHSDREFTVQYDKDTACLYDNPQGLKGIMLPESLFTETGALIGHNKLDGRIFSGYSNESYITFVVRPLFREKHISDLIIDNTVRLLGQTDTDSWVKEIDVKSGDIVEYKIRIQNASTYTVENVNVFDVLPDGMTYIPGSTVLFNTDYPSGSALADGITTTGKNIGAYAPNGEACVQFQARVADADEFVLECTKMINSARAGFPTFGMRENITTVNVFRHN